MVVKGAKVVTQPVKVVVRVAMAIKMVAGQNDSQIVVSDHDDHVTAKMLMVVHQLTVATMKMVNVNVDHAVSNVSQVAQIK